MSNVELDEEENKGLLKSEDQSVKSSNNNEENNKKDSNDKKLPPKQPEIEYEVCFKFSSFVCLFACLWFECLLKIEKFSIEMFAFVVQLLFFVIGNC